MQILAITLFVAIIIASAQALRPLTKQGCQCLSDCKICSQYHSIFGCPFEWQTTWICRVNPKTCDDYTYNAGGKVADHCGSWRDPLNNLFARIKSWFHDTARNVKHLNAKVTEWADEYVHALDVSDLIATEPDVLAKLSSVWDKFDQNQLNQLKSLAGSKLESVIRQIPVEDLTALSKTVQSKLGFGPEVIERLKSITPADVASWAEEQWDRVPVDNLVAMSQGVLQKVPTAQVGKWTQAQWGKLAPAWDKLQDTQLEKLKSLAGSNLDALFTQVSKADLAALSKAVQSKLGFGPEVIERLKSITPADVASWAEEQWDRVPVDNLASMGWSVLQKVPVSEIGKWTKEQWVKIPVDKLVRFTGEQIGKIDGASLAALSDKYWDKVPVYQIVHFSVELIQSAGVLESLNATQIAYFTAEQWRAMPVEFIVKFTVKQLQAIDYKVLGEWTKEMWDKVPIETIAAFVYQQIQAVPPEVVGNWTQSMWLKIPVEQAIMFTGEQLIAGANALKDMTTAQLAQYDWSQIADDALAQLPQALQEKIAALREYAKGFNATKYKKQVLSLINVRSTKNTKLQALQLANDNPEATPELKQKLQNEYNVAVLAELELEQTVKTDQIQISKYVDEVSMYTAPKPVSRGGHATVSAAVLFAALQWL